jgi:epoxide hydrolase
MGMAAEPTPFRIEIPRADVADLGERLRRTRWPERETVGDWSQGVPLAYVQDMCRYWADGYDWRATEARLNGLPQFHVEIDKVAIHFIHVRSARPGALPLIITHGWPRSLIEYLKVIAPLTDPASHGGDPADAFDVVLPSLPGYGFSGQPDRPGWGVERIAAAWAELMARLGYRRYGAAGSDWGTSVTASLGQQDRGTWPESTWSRPWPAPTRTRPATSPKQSGRRSRRSSAPPSGIPATRARARHPATDHRVRAHRLTGRAVRMDHREFWAWTDHRGHLENVLTRDELLDNLMLYWLPRTGASAARLYWESISRVNEWISGAAADPVTVPVGCSIFPRSCSSRPDGGRSGVSRTSATGVNRPGAAISPPLSSRISS